MKNGQEKQRRREKGEHMGLVCYLTLIGYLVLVMGLFVVCSVLASLKTTLLIFGAIHLGCLLMTLVLYWAEVQWTKTAWSKDLEEWPHPVGR